MSESGPDKRLLQSVHGIDPRQSQASLEELLAEHKQHLGALPIDADPADRARLLLDMAETMLGLQQNQESWAHAREALDVFISKALWNEAVEACQILYQADQEDSIAALGQGVWLAITYPIAPQLSVDMLHHIVDETPDESDGGPVAAMAAHYIADLRTEGKDHENLTFLTSQLLAAVAKRHRNIEGQEFLDTWIEILELNDTKILLSRLATIIDTMVGNKWWFDRDQLREKLPVN